jgi:hypothetical protein
MIPFVVLVVLFAVLIYRAPGSAGCVGRFGAFNRRANACHTGPSQLLSNYFVVSGENRKSCRISPLACLAQLRANS